MKKLTFQFALIAIKTHCIRSIPKLLITNIILNNLEVDVKYIFPVYNSKKTFFDMKKLSKYNFLEINHNKRQERLSD